MKSLNGSKISFKTRCFKFLFNHLFFFLIIKKIFSALHDLNTWIPSELFISYFPCRCECPQTSSYRDFKDVLHILIRVIISQINMLKRTSLRNMPCCSSYTSSHPTQDLQPCYDCVLFILFLFLRSLSAYMHFLHVKQEFGLFTMLS